MLFGRLLRLSRANESEVASSGRACLFLLTVIALICVVSARPVDWREGQASVIDGGSRRPSVRGLPLSGLHATSREAASVGYKSAAVNIDAACATQTQQACTRS